MNLLRTDVGAPQEDPVTFAGILGVAALLAGFLPARQASHVDPLVALRTN